MNCEIVRTALKKLGDNAKGSGVRCEGKGKYSPIFFGINSSTGGAKKVAVAVGGRVWDVWNVCVGGWLWWKRFIYIIIEPI